MKRHTKRTPHAKFAAYGRRAGLLAALVIPLGLVDTASSTFNSAVNQSQPVGSLQLSQPVLNVTQGPSQWELPGHPENNDITSVSCPASNWCTAVDTAGNGVLWSGGSWYYPDGLGTGDGTLTSVSCPTTTFCMAVDGRGNAFSGNGSGWWGNSNSALVGQDLTSVSCPTTTFCDAVASSGDIESWYASSGWNSAPPPTLIGLSAVSCHAANWCVAVGQGGTVSWNNGPYSEGGNPAATTCPPGSICQVTPTPTAISCPPRGTSMCMMTLNGANAIYEWNGSSWTWVDSNGSVPELSTLSCTSATFCMGLWNSSTSSLGFEWNGSSWVSEGPGVPGTDYWNSISCFSTAECIAGGNYGYFIFWLPTAVLSATNTQTTANGAYAVGSYNITPDAEPPGGIAPSTPVAAVNGSLNGVNIGSPLSSVSVQGTVNGSSWSTPSASVSMPYPPL